LACSFTGGAIPADSSIEEGKNAMLKNVTDLEVRIREFGRKVTDKENGATMVEYGLLVALIAIVLIVALIFLSGGIGSTFSKAGNCLKN
jgi:pilus assembly protein Flp/PilA